MTRLEEFKQEVAKCNSSVELSALLTITIASICPINQQEGRCDTTACNPGSQEYCLTGMEEYFESELCCTKNLYSEDNQFNWAFLKEKIETGKARQYLAVGDEIEVTLKNDKVITVIVAGIDTYEKNSVLFTLKDCWFKKAAMNEEDINEGGYLQSKMHKEILPEILKLFPDELMNVISPRKITQNLEDVEYSGMAKLWLWSYVEMFGDENLNIIEEISDKDNIWVELFKHPNNRVKKLKDSVFWFWLRSFSTRWNTTFLVVGDDGVVTNGSAGNSYNIRFGFCIS